MIVYFSDRQMQVMGLASTNLPDGFVIIEDLKTEEIETGVATFSCRIGFNDENRLELESMTNAGNFILRSHNGENEFYTIIDTEIDTKNKTINIYAEDAGLDLINEIAGEFEATESHNVAWYVNKYIAGSGFEIGINEVSTASTRKLKWEGEETVTARLASIATQFGGFEISYSFDIDGLTITKKYVNIHKERGKDAGITLRLNKDIDKIITTKSVANLATAFLCEGGVPDNEDKPITFTSKGYTWKDEDDDFYIDGDLLKSKKAIQKWSRKALTLNHGDGVIIRPYSYNTTDPATLRAHAVTELKKVCDMEVNYEVDISVLPPSAKIGDRINIVDDDGELYLSTRILVLETSVVDQKHSAILGEHLIKTSGISQKVADLAEQFAKTSVSAAHALSVANAANTIAEAAQAQAGAAAQESANALAVAGEAQTAAQNATASSNEANAKANAAQEAVAGVQETVSEMEIVVDEAERLAKSAQESATTASAQSAEAKTAAQKAVTNANEAKSAAEEAKTNADSAISTASTASTKADEAKTQAQEASTVAAAAKLDSEQAQKDVEEFANNLETFEATMEANYARKTELTETTAALDAKITANANQLSITHTKVLTVDETANNAKNLAEAAQSAADGAQATASQATAEAAAAQTKADQAKAAAEAAQSNADTAQAAAEAAQGIADQATADLATAKSNLESVTNRVGATEEEVAAAQAAVTTAQAAATKANEDATAAAQAAANAQTTADTAVTNAANAQSAADDAASKANLAQQAADEAKGNASAAQQTANEAKANAATAQATANTAVTNAATAQAKADQAATYAATAQAAAEAADAKAAAAQTDLDTAKSNLEAVKSRVDATEEEIKAAEQAVIIAKQAADDAQDAAVAAQSTADTAKANAATAQAKANEAKTSADNAQKAADKAKEAADKAQADADALAVRVTTAETNITQNSEAIKLAATKTEVAKTLGGYYTKEEADAAIEVSANSVKTTVSNTYATKSELASTDTKASNAATAASNAATAASNAQTTADTAVTNAANAKTAAESAQADVDTLAENVTTNYATKSEVTQTANSITSTVSSTYATKSELASTDTKASNAATAASNAATAASNAQTTADTAVTNAANAKTAAESAQADVDTLAENVTTNYATKSEVTQTANSITSTVSSTYATKSELASTDTKASNAATAASNAATAASNAQTTADTAVTNAAEAQTKAIAAQTVASAAQKAAEDAQEAAAAAQTEADTAKAAAEAAQGIADQATADLATAKSNLESVTNRVGATEEEVAAAQAAVTTAQAAATKANEDATAAAQAAAAAQSTADTAVTNAANAQSAADDAASKANLAQQAADEAKAAADAAQTEAESALSRVVTCESQIVQLDSKITTNVTETDNLKSRASTLEQTASSITSRVVAVENAEIGGRNLFSGYGEEEIQLNDYQNVGSFTQFANHLTFNPCETVGETYTISLWAKSPNGTTPLRIYNSNGNPRHFNFSKTLTESLGNEWAHFNVTITNNDLGASYSDSVCNRIEIYAPNQMGVLVKKIKVEKGNKATDWTPAPEDVDKNINNVADTAGDAKSKADALSEWRVEAQSQIKQLIDKISMLVVGNGATLWEQTDAGWSFNFVDALNTMNAAATNTENITNLTENIDAAKLSIDDLQKELMKNAEYIKFTTVESEETGENLLVNSAGPFVSSTDSNFGHQSILPNTVYENGYSTKFQTGKIYTLIFDWSVDWGAIEPVTDVEIRIGSGEESGHDCYEDYVASMTIPNLSKVTSGKVCFSFTFTSLYTPTSGMTIHPIYHGSRNALDGTTWTISNVRLVEGVVNLEPCIELGVSQTDETTGEVGEGKYKVLITSTRIIFKEGSATPTYISNETLVSEKVEVTQELHHTNASVSGGFVWKMRSNGNFGLSWKGV